MERGLSFDLIFHADTLACDNDGLGVRQQALQDGSGQGAVSMKNLGLFLAGALRGAHHRALLIAQRDDLEEQRSACLVKREGAECVEDEQRGFGVFLAFRVETPRIRGRCQRVDDINRTGKEHGGALEAGGIAQGSRQRRFPQAAPPKKINDPPKG